jgi:hypothetical protein
MHNLYVCLWSTYLHIKFNMLSSTGSLVGIGKMKAKEKFYMATMMLFHSL